VSLFCKLSHSFVNNMFLIYRLIPYLFLLWFGLGAYSLFYFPASMVFWVISLTLIGCAILLAYLLKWRVRESLFWFFLFIPLCFLFATFVLVLLLESFLIELVLFFVAFFLLFLFLHYVFYYLHIPATYRPYAIEHLTLLLHLLSFFYLMTMAYAMRLFFQTPLLLLALLSLIFISFFLISIYWVSKISLKDFFSFIFIGTILLTESFIALLLLPTSLFTNAALLTILFYFFVETTRTHLLTKLSSRRLQWLSFGSGFLFLIIVLSAQWF